MVARRFNGLEIFFAPDARAALECLAPEAKNRVLTACEALAELASVAPLPTDPGLPALSSVVSDVEITYEVRSSERAIWVQRIARRG